MQKHVTTISQALINNNVGKDILLLTFKLNSKTYITSGQYVNNYAEINLCSTVRIHII